MAAEKYDLIVIGSGPAGEKGAAQAAFFGKRVALIEKEPVLGGAAANTGTLPSKTLRETALFISGYRQRELYHVDLRGLKERVSLPDFLTREHLVKETERARIMANLRRHHVHLLMGMASFVDEHTVAVRPDRCPEFLLQGDVILLATGSYPYRPPGLPFQDPRVYDSDTILSLREMPASMLVVGGGVIGCEYACVFATLGIRVTLVEKRGRLIDHLDAEIAEALRVRMEAIGVQFIFNDTVAEVDTGDVLRVLLHSGTELTPETILVSSGRCGNVEALGLDRVGIACNKRGQIDVNEHYQTSVPHIYAAGDVVGSPALASTSMDQARVAMVHAFNLKYREGLTSILPAGVYTIPECAMVGQTEEELMQAKVPFVAGRASYAGNARGQIIGDAQGFLKLLFHREDMRLLGAHMIGEQATELIHVALTALLTNAGADLFIRTCYNYPTLSEMYKYATYDAMGRAIKRDDETQTQNDSRIE